MQSFHRSPKKLSTVFFVIILALAACPLGHAQVARSTDPLPSWNEGATKKSILDFVARTTTSGNPDFVASEDRVATFDNDGTLWVEQPVYTQFIFMIDRIKAMAPQHPEWKTEQPFKAVLEGDKEALLASGEAGVIRFASARAALPSPLVAELGMLLLTPHGRRMVLLAVIRAATILRWTIARHYCSAVGFV